MPATFTPGPNLVTVQVTNPARDDFGGLRIWRSTVNGFAHDASNLVYDGLDLTVVLTDLPGGVPQYFKYATYSEIDTTDYDVSAQATATPTTPSVNAEFIIPGTIRGSNMFAGSFGTKGSTLTANSVAAQATLNVGNTADFPAPGGMQSAVIFSPTTSRDRDHIFYTGKTATSLTGVTGNLAHTAGEVIIPLAKAMVIDQNVGEMRFYSDRGDGVIEEMANIGEVSTAPSGTILDDAIVAIGSYAPAFDMVPLHVRTGNTYGVYAHRLVPPSGNQPVGFFYAQGAGNGPALWALIDGTNSTYAMYAVVQGTVGGTAIKGSAQGAGSNGVEGQASNATLGAFGVKGIGNRGYGVYAAITGNGVPLFIEPTTTPTLSLAAGAMYCSPSGVFFGHDGASWRSFLRDNDRLYANAGTVALPGVTFTDNNGTGIRLKGGSSLAFSTNGTEAGVVDAANNWTFNGRIFSDSGTGLNPTYGFTDHPGVGVYAASGNLRFAVAGALALELTSGGNLRHLKPPRYPFTTGNPAAASVVTTVVDQYGFYSTGTGTKASLTVDLPPSPNDGQEFVFGTRGTYTAITFRNSAGVAIVGAPATLPQGGAVRFWFDSATGLWYPVGIS